MHKNMIFILLVFFTKMLFAVFPVNEIFTKEQTSDLYSIANQCPLAGGEAVYQACAMYSLIDAEAYYLDKELCIQSGNNWRKGEVLTVINEFELYPNPAQSAVIVHLPISNKVVSTVYFYDCLGKVVKTENLTNNEVEQIIDVSNLSGGIYYYKLLQDGDDSFSGKLIIIK